AAVVELNRVNPGGEIRVLAVRHPAWPGRGFDRKSFRPLQGRFHEEVRLIADPRMIETEMVRHKVEQQFQSVGAQFFAELLEGGLAAEFTRDGIVAKGEWRA